MQVSVAVSNEILNWIMAHVQLEVLPQQIADNLDQWCRGVKTPTFHQIEKASQATGIPLGYFFLKTPPAEDSLLAQYRTIDSVELNRPSRNLTDVMHHMDLVQEWTREHLISEGASAVTFVGACAKRPTVESIANAMRTALRLAPDWFKQSKSAEASFQTIRTTISDAGVFVMMSGIVENNTHRALDINEFRAFAMVDDYAPLVFINANDSVNGKLFSLLHEFAHICVGESDLFNDRDSTGNAVKPVETLCNAAAAEILVPREFFVQAWKGLSPELDTDQRISALAKVFRCGSTVIARKALDHGLIDHSQYQQIARLAVKRYQDARRRKKELGESGGNYYGTLASRIDRRFLGMLTGSVAEGKTLYSDAFRLTNTNRTTFAALLEHVGGAKT